MSELFSTQLTCFSLYCHFYFLQVLIIEVNTVPGMTPSTVLIQQVKSGSPCICMFPFYGLKVYNHKHTGGLLVSKLLKPHSTPTIYGLIPYVIFCKHVLCTHSGIKMLQELYYFWWLLTVWKFFLVNLRHYQNNLPCILTSSFVHCLIWGQRGLSEVISLKCFLCFLRDGLRICFELFSELINFFKVIGTCSFSIDLCTFISRHAELFM